MFVGGLVDEVFELHDLPGVFEHVLLHFVEDDVLSRAKGTRSSCSLSLRLVSSCICLSLGGVGLTDG